ncbi:MAG: putative zinc-binding protein [Methanosarcina sp.]
MAENKKCSCCGDSITTIFPCVGAANVGQISNKIAIELEKRGVGNFMCTAGIGARASGLMKSAEASDRIIAIDGCPVNCASKTLELAGFKVDDKIVISELGIKKTKEKDLKDNEVSEALEKTLEILQSS